MAARIVLVFLFCLCMATACREAHVDGTSETTFRASIMRMNAEHSVEDGQRFGARLQRVEARLGKAATRRAMNGMTYAEAQRFLDSTTAAQ